MKRGRPSEQRARAGSITIISRENPYVAGGHSETVVLPTGAASWYRTHYVHPRELGRGAFGAVYRVTSVIDGADYAMKIGPKMDRHGRSIKNEVFALAAIGTCPHVVRFCDAWEEEGEVHIKMELCDGNLRQIEQHLLST